MGKTGQVLIYFIVDSNGDIADVKLHKSVEYSLDQEALRLIRQSPKWEPAFQNGKNVKAYRRQPVTFSF
jgi:protein TonB